MRNGAERFLARQHRTRYQRLVTNRSGASGGAGSVAQDVRWHARIVHDLSGGTVRFCSRCRGLDEDAARAQLRELRTGAGGAPPCDPRRVCAPRWRRSTRRVMPCSSEGIADSRFNSASPPPRREISKRSSCRDRTRGRSLGAVLPREAIQAVRVDGRAETCDGTAALPHLRSNRIALMSVAPMFSTRWVHGSCFIANPSDISSSTDSPSGR